jgi:polar amino acid transport system substrate-binding protein
MTLRAISRVDAVSAKQSGGPARTLFKALAPALCLSLLAIGARADNVPPLRLCADPDNLPFSSDKPSDPGLYNEIGSAIAQELNRPVETVWHRTNFGKRAIRSTLLAKQCDIFIGLPADPDLMGPALIFSKPFMQAGYALVTKQPADGLSIGKLNGLAVAVQFGTPPQNFLANYGAIRMVTRMSPEEGIAALTKGEADAAFIWAPSAGYVNKTQYSGSLNIVPIDGPGMQWPVAAAFAKRDTALRDEVDVALEKIAGKIAALKTKYGFPVQSPVKLGSAAFARKGTEFAEAVQLVQAAATDAKPGPAEPTAIPAGLSAEGKELFNGTCAHCHGPNGVQSERKIDLRLLHHRYGEGMEEMFHKTVRAGRVAKGMPSWKDVFTDEQFTAIYAYLSTIQTKELTAQGN